MIAISANQATIKHAERSVLRADSHVELLPLVSMDSRELFRANEAATAHSQNQWFANCIRSQRNLAWSDACYPPSRSALATTVWRIGAIAAAWAVSASIPIVLKLEVARLSHARANLLCASAQAAGLEQPVISIVAQAVVMTSSDAKRIICRLASPDWLSMTMPAAENAFTFSGERNLSRSSRLFNIDGTGHRQSHEKAVRSNARAAFSVQSLS
jgi:hypothetical protein